MSSIAIFLYYLKVNFLQINGRKQEDKQGKFYLYRKKKRYDMKNIFCYVYDVFYVGYGKHKKMKLSMFFCPETTKRLICYD